MPIHQCVYFPEYIYIYIYMQYLVCLFESTYHPKVLPGQVNICRVLSFSILQVIQREPWEHIRDEDIKKAAASFCGEIYQVPPMFSAIKVKEAIRFTLLFSMNFT